MELCLAFIYNDIDFFDMKRFVWQRGETLLCRGGRAVAFHSKQTAFFLKHRGFYFEISFSRRSRGAARSPGRGG